MCDSFVGIFDRRFLTDNFHSTLHSTGPARYVLGRYGNTSGSH